MLANLARTCYRRRRLVLGLWVVLFILALVAAPALKGDYANSGRLSGTDSQAAYDTLAKDFPARHGDEAQIVFGDVTKHRAAIDSYLKQVAKVTGVISVEPLRVSKGGLIAVAPITTKNGNSDHPQTTATDIKDLAKSTIEKQGVQVEFAGPWFGNQTMPASEIIGVLAAIIVLLIAFGSVIAMGLPIATALIGIAISLAGVGILANVFTTPSFAPQVAAMIGIGVGIDYALFIVTRYREALHRTNSPEASVVEAMTTSGRAVIFAGFTVMVSVLGMFLMGINFLHGLAVGVSLAVVIAMAAATTLLPALLGFVGFTIDRLHVGRRKARTGEGMWHRWARTIQRRPWPIAVAGFLFLVIVALPVFSLRLGSADASNDPTTSTTHKAYNLIAKGFGPGSNGPVLVVATGKDAGANLGKVVSTLRTTPGVASVTNPSPNPSGNAALATLFPTTGPQAKATENLIHHLRDNVIPQATAGTGTTVNLGGQTASAIDFSDVIGSRMPIFIGAVLVLSFILLLVVFRSVLVPLKAVVMNLLSIGAAYGVIVAIFQWGWGASFFGVEKAPIEAWVPMMLFAIVFGLSMDYEVFLLSGIREHYQKTGNNAEAVAEGLASTARVITAAALIMVFVFGSFVLSDLRALKLIGLGLAVAVFIDASVVRVVLVPATMELLGNANWWLPKWLDRIVPHVLVEDAPPTLPEGFDEPVLEPTH
ncbi:MAG: putative superfamily drug exporter [Actinomycetia bacterium]|nr:putative superfamily drug exporter [Actinomycetes bacterium]